MAKGVLMERLGVGEREALRVMTTQARAQETLLSTVAQEILDPATDLDPTP
jgi:AmiR/NasT family two-component response regulator